MAFMPAGANALNVASAKVDRHELPVHKNNMFIAFPNILMCFVPLAATVDD
jgi:hypothetical protein